MLALIASGLSDRDIAEATGMNENQVRWATRCVIAKLGAANRPHAVARAIVAGYLQSREDARSDATRPCAHEA